MHVYSKATKNATSLFHSGFWFCLFYLIGLGGGFETYTELWNSLIMQVYANLFKINEKCCLSSIQKSQQICTWGGNVYYASHNLLFTCSNYYQQKTERKLNNKTALASKNPGGSRCWGILQLFPKLYNVEENFNLQYKYCYLYNSTMEPTIFSESFIYYIMQMKLIFYCYSQLQMILPIIT